MTAKYLEHLSDSDQDFEIVRGVPYALAPASVVHLAVMGRLISEVGAYLKATESGIAGKGGFLFERDPDTMLEPGLAVILSDNIPRLPLTGFVPFIPPLVAEVRSLEKRGVAMAAKIDIDRQAGVQIIWIIDPHAAAPARSGPTASRTSWSNPRR